ncbi:MAG: hypothetical protein Kow0063_15510 [Anaerolineae bacterium]
MSSDCVVDASVGIKLFLIEPLSERADALFNQLTETPPVRFYVPDLFDATYVALSQKLSLPLVTADEKLARRLAKHKSDIRFLADW